MVYCFGNRCDSKGAEMNVLGAVASVCDVFSSWQMEVAAGGSSHLIFSSLCMYCKRNYSGVEGRGTFGLGHL